MTLLEKLKVNLDYLLGKADPSLYAPVRNQNVSLEDWNKRWEMFSNGENGFVWYGIDEKGHIGEFRAINAYIPEIYFDNPFLNKKISDYFDSLPEITKGKVSPKLLKELKPTPEREEIWAKDSNKGLFIFEELEEIYREGNRNSYELTSFPQKSLSVSELPDFLQNRLNFFQLENLNFKECEFLDISKYFHCEE